ncbi:SGNH/GDSL hydrolase family protein [Chitinophaga sancti]|uniref:GDSL-like Lipase/Acylhydrolase family protein n=1 Tax=Chitinophaga sancti TaxID=1004 RepID=A0A1K1M436_9BACT|nr:SGNH/GDSL hydrolase family protein [Chitinophaga sancti]WQD64646.1 SGNH/GDSL hydrolase family protein [Chitinophaga sancti]WQG89731.1 SGNH/GDSL hydrolase family protein [Chitinophaga sancti]SFW17909.1 GDSL-like Lipase/Acylhydrolase family protein [Chitinophaga sancti]
MIHRILFSLLILCSLQTSAQETIDYRANHPYIQYTGRVVKPSFVRYRFWQPGVYIRAKFSGTYCNIVIEDEVRYNQHNYLAIQVDDQPARRIEITSVHNVIKAASNLPDGEHMITICKNTEAGIGYLDFLGFQCAKLLPITSTPSRRLEFIGNSITCGTGSDQSSFPCGTGQWYDQHNAYMSYGPLTARNLDAKWMLSSVSGIGLIHSCCDMKITMPQVFDKINMRDDSLKWNFETYQPHVVTVCLGQNDGKQDAATFCKAYVQFIRTLRGYYPDASIILLSSPMADAELSTILKSNIKKTVATCGDKNVSYYFFSKRYHGGCGDHPTLEEHKLIAGELTAYIKKLKGW